MEFESIQGALLEFHFRNSELDDDVDVAKMFSRLNGPEEVIHYAHSLKIEGNSLFKQGHYLSAFGQCLRGVKSICFASEEDGLALIRELSISLNLNLAACALKLDRYAQAHELCSLVLGFDNSNIKALFRRAQAFVKSGFPKKAQDDLVNAVKLDPCNKDILQELCHVKSLLASLESGDDIPSSYSYCGGPTKAEIAYQMKGEAVVDVGFTGETSSMGGQKMATKSEDCMELDTQNVAYQEGMNNPSSTVVSGPCADINREDTNLNKHCGEAKCEAKTYTFVNKRKPSSKLKLPATNFKKLASGKVLQFYHPSSFSLITVRVISPSTDILTEAPDDLRSRGAVASINPMDVDKQKVGDDSTSTSNFVPDVKVQENFVPDVKVQEIVAPDIVRQHETPYPLKRLKTDDDVQGNPGFNFIFKGLIKHRRVFQRKRRSLCSESSNICRSSIMRKRKALQEFAVVPCLSSKRLRLCIAALSFHSSQGALGGFLHSCGAFSTTSREYLETSCRAACVGTNKCIFLVM